MARGLENIEFAAGAPHLLKGGYSEQASSGVDVYSIRQPLGRRRRHHAVQLPGHGADVDVLQRAGLRQHVRAQAQREGPVGLAAAGRPAAPGRAAGRRVQRRAGRPGRRSTRCSPTRTCRRSASSAPPRSRRHVYETGTRAGKRVQALGGAKNHMVVLPDADVGCGRRRRGLRRLRLGGGALHGGLRRGGGRRGRRPAGRGDRASGSAGSRSARPATRPPRWAR